MKHVKILGAGCRNCQTTLNLIEEVTRAQSVEIELEKVDQIQDIMPYRLMATPGVVIDDEVVHSGGVPNSLSFVVGLSLTFTALGLAAGLFGTLFGTLGGGWNLAVGALALVMGGQMMGLYTIPFPVAPQYRPKQGGLIGAFLLGLLFGAVSSPCATPALVVILSFVATQGELTRDQGRFQLAEP